MDPDQVKYVERRLKVGSLDVHPRERAIVVNYDVEATLVGENGEKMLEQNKTCQKIIRIKSLDSSTNLDSLATEIVKKCNLIPQTKIDEVRQLLFYLQTRQNRPQSSVRSTSSLSNRRSSHLRPQTAIATRLQEIGLDTDTAVNHDDADESDHSNGDRTANGVTSGALYNQNHNKNLPQASLAKLDEYIEGLYEEMREKIKGSWMILNLARQADNLNDLTSNETLLCALSRVLREDGKKSIELAFNIVQIFALFSNYSQFHPIISQYKVGATCYELIQWQIETERASREQIYAMAEQSKDDSGQISEESERAIKKHEHWVRKQDQLLRVAVYLLLNLSEDIKVEQKMVNKGIIDLLVDLLDRKSTNLLLLAISFLKKASIYLENKDRMKHHMIVDKLDTILGGCESNDQPHTEALINVTCRLLFNLSFDNQLRTQMMSVNLLEKLIGYLMAGRHETVAWSLLYQFSRDDTTKEMIGSSQKYAQLIPFTVRKIIDHASGQLPAEMIAFAVNLALDLTCAKLIAEQFDQLMKRALKFEDVSLMKLLRNIAQHEDPQLVHLFLGYIDELMDTVSSDRNEDFALECLGVLVYMSSPEIAWKDLLGKHNLIEWIKDHIQSGAQYEDDLILEAVMLIGTAAKQPECAALLLQIDIISHLIQLLTSKQEDDEIVLQIMFAVQIMLRHETIRPELVKNSQLIMYLLDLMHDKNSRVQGVCRINLQIIAECDSVWAERIKEEQFTSYNKQWLEAIQSNLPTDPYDDGVPDLLDMDDGANGYLNHNYNLLLRTADFTDSDEQSGSDQYPISEKKIIDQSLDSESPMNPKVAISNFSSTVAHQQATNPSRPHTGYHKRTSIK